MNQVVQLTRIYTKGGDKGKTSLGNGKRVLKSSPRIEAIGQVDEVNAFIGLCAHEPSPICNFLKKIQMDLFDLGADLCMPDLDEAKLRITPDHVQMLEDMIDHYNQDLAPLNSFVLPGGSLLSSYLHIARTTTRRAERFLCSLQESEPLNPQTIIYLNRLSDLLFVLGRYMNDKGSKDVLWIPGYSIQEK